MAPNGKRLLVNAGSNTAAFLATLAVSFVLAPVVLRALGDVRFGAWAFAESFIAYLTLFDMGVAAALVRFVPRALARDDHAELVRLASSSNPSDPGLVDAHDRIHNAERRVTEIEDELAALNGNLIDEAEVAAALTDFDAVWDRLAPREQTRVIELLVEQITYDGKDGNISITFRPTGIKTLAGELGDLLRFLGGLLRREPTFGDRQSVPVGDGRPRRDARGIGGVDQGTSEETPVLSSSEISAKGTRGLPMRQRHVRPSTALSRVR